MVSSGDLYYIYYPSINYSENNKYQSGHKFCLFQMQFDKNKHIHYALCW